MKPNTIPQIFIALLLFTFALATQNAKAQSLHFSQNAMTPLITNPANVGLFSGDVRVGGIYRSQWTSINPNGFRTIALSADTKIIKGITDGDWISGGFTFYNDKVGTVGWVTNTLLFTAGYNLNLFGEGKNYISVGIQSGLMQQKLDLSNAQFDEQFNDGVFNANNSSLETINNDGKFSPSFSIGGMYYNISSLRNYFFVGASMGQMKGIKNPRLQSIEKNPIPLRLSLQAGMSQKMTDKIDLVPSMFIFSEGTAFKTDLLVGARYVFLENTKNQILNAFLFSGGIRINANKATDTGITRTDAFIMQAGIEVERITASLAYDANISDLKVATNSNGAVEMAISYNIGYRNNKRTGGAVNCPRF